MDTNATNFSKGFTISRYAFTISVFIILCNIFIFYLKRIDLISSQNRFALTQSVIITGGSLIFEKNKKMKYWYVLIFISVFLLFKLMDLINI